jgi:hypothetical protein
MTDAEREQVEAIVQRVAQEGGTQEDAMREIIRVVIVRPLVEQLAPLASQLFQGSTGGVADCRAITKNLLHGY